MSVDGDRGAAASDRARSAKAAQICKVAHLLASIAVVGVSSLLGRLDRVGQLVNQLQAKNECDPSES